jgi:hypothetical protein
MGISVAAVRDGMSSWQLARAAAETFDVKVM